jgi:hypothetical protein
MALTTPSASPAITVKEIDLSGFAPNVTTSTGAFVGKFRWGPAEERTLVADEAGLVQVFAAPNEDHATDFLSAVYFLKYSNSLFVVRGHNGSKNAHSGYAADVNTSDSGDNIVVKNTNHFDTTVKSSLNASTNNSGAFISRFPGALGNGLSVTFCPADSADRYFNQWDYRGSFDRAPTSSSWATDRSGTLDEIHVAVIDRKGEFTGTPGSVLETFPHLSVAKGAVSTEGEPQYVVDAINQSSGYIRMSGYFDGDSAFSSTLAGGQGIGQYWGTTPEVDSATNFSTGTSGWLNWDSDNNALIKLSNGADDTDFTAGDIGTAFDLFEDTENVTVDFLISPVGNGSVNDSDAVTIVNDLNGIAQQTRKDCVVVTSPKRNDTVGVAAGTAVSNAVTFANSLTNSSYLVVDNNYLKVFDKYNDKYVFIPAASSTAGLMAATDAVAAPWFSPAGQRRGNYVGVTDLAITPNKTQRDTLYKAGINPIANIPGAAIVLFGDKTHENRPSAFDRINVRRLFLALERSIAAAAKNILFEFNDEFTRAEFVNVVEPLLREIRGRRGITDFRVVCDETNNTPAVVDRNEFVASIFIKPARSINYVTLNFVAVRTGVQFDEVVGAV